MEDKKDAVNTTDSAASQEDIEAKIALLEQEKARAITEAANWKLAFFKNKKAGEEETDEQRIRRITREELDNAKISSIDDERETLLKKALKENKELKLAHLNKTTVPASVTTSTESQSVKDTLVTPEQMEAFKKMGKDDKWIEKYKKNLLKNSR